MSTVGLCWIFFLSGVAALLFENLWFQQAGLTLGNSVWASSLVLAGFMAGLGLGNLLAARFGHRIARPVRFYAGLELAIGLAGLALVFFLPSLTPLLARLVGPVLEDPWLVNPLRLVLGFVLLVAPATAMGATLPVIVSALYRHDPRFGRVLGLLYGWNTLGAVLGAVLGELFLVEALGVRGTGCVALSVNAVAAGTAWLLSRRAEGGEGVAPRPAPPAIPARAFGLLAAAAIFGFALLGLEVVWFRFLLLYLWGTGGTFAILLAVVLAGIALGGLAAGAWSARGGRPTEWLPALACLAGALCLLLYASYPSGPRLHTWADAARHAGFLMLPVAFLSGILFTLLGEALEETAPGESRAAGILTLANTVGAALGSLAAGFVLLPWLGVEASWVFLAALYALAALAAFAGGARPTSRARRAASLGALALLFVSLLLPWGLMQTRHLRASVAYYLEDGRSEVAGVREGLTETIVYLRERAFGEPHTHRMLTNGYSMSSTSFYAQRYMKLFVHLPAALHPDLRSALLISYGVGMTAEALAHTASLERIDVVDISRDVLEMNRIVFPDPATAPLSDPRFRVHVEDGRHFLATTRERFDLITGEPPPPKLAGVTSLYTREYFALVRERLNPGGYVSYWLPVHTLVGDDAPSMVRAFCDVFPDCSLWGGSGLDWILLGSNGASGRIPPERLRRPWQTPETAAELREIGVETPAALAALFMADADQLEEFMGAAPPLTDDHPKRLSEVPPDFAGEARRHAAWMDVRTSWQRFLESAWVKSRWPAMPQGRTSRAFSDEGAYQRIGVLGRRPFEQVLPELHRLLERSPSRTLPLWLLGSDAKRQAAAARRVAQAESAPAARAVLGLGQLAARRYAEAARAFEAARGGMREERLRHLELYARLMAGDRGPRVQQDLAHLRASPLAPDARALAFFVETFGATAGP